MRMKRGQSRCERREEGECEGRPVAPFAATCRDRETSFAQYAIWALHRAENQDLSISTPAADEPLLNGVPYLTFRQTVDLAARRDAGAFFSGSAAADVLVSLLRERVPEGGLVMDPACGMGDLLLSFAKTLPLRTTLKETVRDWGACLAGMDLNESLVQLTKARLVMLARVRGGFSDHLARPEEWFPHIACGDMLTDTPRLEAADGFLFNPPFTLTPDASVPWAKGRINAASIFLDKLLSAKRSSVAVAAILPEVLRCGSRYARFRKHLSSRGFGATAISLGRFDKWTDVDVFATLFSDADTTELWPSKFPSACRSVGDLFDVSVGPVVPHRHPHLGPWRRFVCAKTVPAWSQLFEPKRSRRFRGTVYQPPFVVIRRTSSPSDKSRAVGAIISGHSPVAIENHLLVVRPRSGTLHDCQRLLRVLRDQCTSDYLNTEIRCRHLTTAIIASIPWNESNG
jgi:hypothetical protein